MDFFIEVLSKASGFSTLDPSSEKENLKTMLVSGTKQTLQHRIFETVLSYCSLNFSMLVTVTGRL